MSGYTHRQGSHSHLWKRKIIFILWVFLFEVFLKKNSFYWAVFLLSKTLQKRFNTFKVQTVAKKNLPMMPTSSILLWVWYAWGFPSGSMVKNLPASAGDMSLIPRLGRSPGEGNGNPLRYSCLGNPMDRGAWWAIVQRIQKELDTT